MRHYISLTYCMKVARYRFQKISLRVIHNFFNVLDLNRVRTGNDFKGQVSEEYLKRVIK